MRSQKHLRTVLGGFDSAGNTAYDSTGAREPLPFVALVKNQAGQTVDFKRYFPTGSSFAISGGPTGMTINASSGVLSGTPTATQNTTATLTITYRAPSGGDRSITAFWPFTST